MQDDAAGGGAALAGGAEGSPERAFNGEVEVGVVEDDHGVLSAHFQGTGLEVGGGGLSDDAADLGGSGKGDGADAGMGDDGRAGVGSEAGDDVDDSGGQAGVDEALDEVVGGERSVFGGLDDAGVAADECGEELPRGDGHGEVPGGDHAADADRHADGHGELGFQFRWGGLAEEAAAFAGHVVGGVDGLLHVATGFGEDLAHLAGHVAGVLLLTLGEEFSGLVEDFGALGRGRETPALPGLGGGGDGVVDVGGGGGLEFADDVVGVGGIDVEEGLAGAGGNPLTADEVFVELVGHRVLRHGICFRGCGIGQTRQDTVSTTRVCKAAGASVPLARSDLNFQMGAIRFFRERLWKYPS